MMMSELRHLRLFISILNSSASLASPFCIPLVIGDQSMKKSTNFRAVFMLILFAVACNLATHQHGRQQVVTFCGCTLSNRLTEIARLQVQVRITMMHGYSREGVLYRVSETYWIRIRIQAVLWIRASDTFELVCVDTAHERKMAHA